MDADEIARRLGAIKQQFPRLLRCDQCGKISDDRACGWQARLVMVGRTVGPEVAVYCPACAERQFSE
jgi:hypothetical protein